MTEIVFDIEADNLLDSATKIHCLSYSDDAGHTVHTITEYSYIQTFLGTRPDAILVGHHIIGYDIPMLEKFITKTKIKNQLIDTLALSWYLHENRPKHGLEYWGEDLGVEKPVITDWENLRLSDYIHRCEEDVKINCKLWFDVLKPRLQEIYK